MVDEGAMRGCSMQRWRRGVRIAMIAVAGIVLLVTAVPQVASGIGLSSLATRLASPSSCSGSSGGSGSSGSCCSSGSGSASGSSGCNSGPATVTGTATITGAPSGFVAPFVGAGACPFTGPASVHTLCPDPNYALVDSGLYTLSLTPGTWVIEGFYEINAFGGAFLGAPEVVTLSPGQSSVLDVSIKYSKPATLDVGVRVKRLPAGVALENASVILCPAGSSYSGGTQPLTCVNSYGYGSTSRNTGRITITGLSKGVWTAYPGYCTMFGCVTNPAAGVSLTLFPGRTTREKITTGYLRPPEGLVDASVAVSGAPAGFSATTGVSLCQIQATYTDCESGESYPPGAPEDFELTTGVWEISGYYLAPVFANPITGPTSIINVRGGRTVDVTVTVPYQVLGTATGSIRVPGKPADVKITSYSVTACPAHMAISLGLYPCVSEYSGPGEISYGPTNIRGLGRSAKRVSVARSGGMGLDTYILPTLTPGKWDLTASYTTAYGTFYSPATTKITITAGQTSTRNLFDRYQKPTVGEVTGRVTVVDAPAYSFEAGAQACSTAPVAGTCAAPIVAYLDQNGTYQLTLSPGTWWVSGLVYLYGSTSTQTITSSPRKVTVVAGSKSKASFIVPVG